MRAKAIAAFLAASTFAALLPLPAVAVARPRPASRAQRPEVDESLSVFGTHGFQIKVDVKDRRRFLLAATRLGAPAGKAGIAIEGASYMVDARQRPGSDSIVGRIGRLGHVDVRFIPSKIHREKPPRGCHGDPIVTEEGLYVGLIAFHGEQGYTQVRARRAPGTIVRTPPLRCAPEPAPNLKKLKRELEELESAEGKEEDQEQGEEVESLSAKLTVVARRHRIDFKATKAAVRSKGKKGFALTSFLVTGSRRRGRIEEKGVAAVAFESGSTFLIPDRRRPTSELTLKPPAPFTGSATFRRHRSKPPTWAGDLRVALPGFGSVRLAGPGTHAKACGGTACLL